MTRLAPLLWLILLATAVGCQSPTEPDGSDMSDGGNNGSGSSQPSVIGTVDGDSFMATEIESPEPVDVLGMPLLTVSATDRPRGWRFAWGAPARVGTHLINQPSSGVQGNLLQLAPGSMGDPPADAPAWFAAFGLGGSGSVTVDTLTETGATGTFSFNLVPNPVTDAMGNKTVSATFVVTFSD